VFNPPRGISLVYDRINRLMFSTAATSKKSFPPISRRFLGLGLLVGGLLLMSLAGAYFGAVYFGSRNLDRLIFQTGQGDRDSDQRMLSDLLPGTDAAGSSGVLPAPPPHAQVLYPGSFLVGVGPTLGPIWTWAKRPYASGSLPFRPWVRR